MRRERQGKPTKMFGRKKLHAVPGVDKQEQSPRYYVAGGINKNGITRMPSGPPPKRRTESVDDSRCTDTYDTPYGPRQCGAVVVPGYEAQHRQTQHRPPIR